MRFILGLFWLAVIVYTVMDILKSGASSGKKVLWIALVVIFPLLGSIGWFFLGRK